MARVSIIKSVEPKKIEKCARLFAFFIVDILHIAENSAEKQQTSDPISGV